MPVYLPIKPKDRLYQEIVDQIQQQILSGALKPGDQIPAERDLADRFGVSRTAVREAIKSLTEKGLIEVYVGRGTFVTSLSPDRVVESMTMLLRNEPHNVASLHEARELLEVPTPRRDPVEADHSRRALVPEAPDVHPAHRRPLTARPRWGRRCVASCRRPGFLSRRGPRPPMGARRPLETR